MGFNTRNGCRACAIYSAILSIGLIFFYVYKLTRPGGISTPDDPDYGSEKNDDIRYKVWFVFVAVYSVYFITSFMLLNGVDKSSPGIMLYFLVFIVLFTVLDTGLIIFVIIKHGFMVMLFEVILYAAKSISNVIVFSVVVMEYKATKERNKTERYEYRNNQPLYGVGGMLTTIDIDQFMGLSSKEDNEPGDFLVTSTPYEEHQERRVVNGKIGTRSTTSNHNHNHHHHHPRREYDNHVGNSSPKIVRFHQEYARK
ncbi:uncharacterized protein [Ptychodera flava]|uniref:uncharacterized protein n=1 Tax=Ptychodera flava TaxID=63121 RepID=UPI003969BF28